MPHVNVRTPADIPYTKGLHELAAGTWAWIQPDGHSDNNAGIVVGKGQSLIVDTTYELRGTQGMLDAASSVLDENPITLAVNTHEDQDHTWGNQLLPADAVIYASAGCMRTFLKLLPQDVRRIMRTDFGEGTPWVLDNYRNLDIDEIVPRLPDVAIEEDTALDVGGRAVHLLPVCPAHSNGDVIVHVPDVDVIFTGDLLFIEVGAAMNAGPLSRWIDALDRMIGLSPKLVVPGHGPVTDVSGLVGFRNFLETMAEAARAGLERGMTPEEAADLVDPSLYASVFAGERVITLLDGIYADFDPAHRRMSLGDTGAASERLRQRLRSG